MNNKELAEVFEKHSSAIIAPAGHGKTEMISEIVKHSSGRQLVLTHTNAGVDAIEKRLKKQNISKDKYTVTTIAAFCIKWCMSYNKTAEFDVNISPITEAKRYYPALYKGMKYILDNDWCRRILKSTYTGVIVDEYQDCIIEQHEIILKINQYLPVRVFGDPLQGIFNFAGKLVDWNSLEFPIIKIETKPWRWQKSNPKLGEFLNSVRIDLLPILEGKQCTLSFNSDSEFIEILSPYSFTGYSHLKELSKYSSIVYITKWPTQQLLFCQKMPGIFQYDEKQECDDLFYYAEQFDKLSGTKLALAVIQFANECATCVNTELKSYKNRLEIESFDFSRITKHSDFGEILTKEGTNISKNTILKLLQWFIFNPNFKRYRTELLAEMERSVKYAIDYNISISEAANHIRKDVNLQKRYNGFKFLSSRTLLSKGLEFDCVIIDMTTLLSARDFYVAMTRAMKKIYIISDTTVFQFNE